MLGNSFPFLCPSVVTSKNSIIYKSDLNWTLYTGVLCFPENIFTLNFTWVYTIVAHICIAISTHDYQKEKNNQNHQHGENSHSSKKSS